MTRQRRQLYAALQHERCAEHQRHRPQFRPDPTMRLATSLDATGAISGFQRRWQLGAHRHRRVRRSGQVGICPARVRGLGNTISNLSISNSFNNQGLFGFVHGGTIRDIGMVNAAISGAGDVGALVGAGEGGAIIQNSWSTGTVTGIASGLAVWSARKWILRKWRNWQLITDAAIRPPSPVPWRQRVQRWRPDRAIIDTNSFVTNSYATGAVNANGGSGYAGGLVGQNGGSIDILLCYRFGHRYRRRRRPGWWSGGWNNFSDHYRLLRNRCGHRQRQYVGGLVGLMQRQRFLCKQYLRTGGGDGRRDPTRRSDRQH